MVWVASEDAACEVTEFDPVDEMDVPELMAWYRVDMSSPERFRVRDVEDGMRIVYEGAIYRGGFGVNLWVARKFADQ